jgi:hypothetical protein
MNTTPTRPNKTGPSARSPARPRTKTGQDNCWNDTFQEIIERDKEINKTNFNDRPKGPQKTVFTQFDSPSVFTFLLIMYSIRMQY